MHPENGSRIPSVYVRAILCEVHNHRCVKKVDILFGKEAATYARLVGNDDGLQAEIVDQLHRLDGAVRRQIT
jgi:hypothetical protein